jgi:hypothetical protein
VASPLQFTPAEGHALCGEGRLSSQRHIHSKVRCPAVVIRKKGNNFTCIATVRIGKGKHKTRVERYSPSPSRTTKATSPSLGDSWRRDHERYREVRDTIPNLAGRCETPLDKAGGGFL